MTIPARLTLEVMAVLINAQLDEQGISQAEFARRVGHTPKHINTVLSHRQHASVATLDYWAFVLGFRFVVTLVALDDDPSTSRARSTGDDDVTTTKTAFLSDCGTYRYELTRTWNEDGMRICWLMLNPSTADASVDDATILTISRLSERWGYGSLVVANLFAYRSRDPKALRSTRDPIGPGNDACIFDAVCGAHLTVAAWGAHGVLRNRGAEMTQRLTGAGFALWCVGINKGGHPRHPLYLPDDTELTLYRSPA